MTEATEELKETVSPNGDSESPVSGLTKKSTLVPVLTTAAAAAAAGLAATKGPDLLKKLSGEADHRAEELGGKAAAGAKKEILGGGSGGSGGGAGMLGTVGNAASKLLGGGGGGGGQKGGKTRRLPIQRWTDVAVPVNKAYEAWTNFEEFPKFMHRVLEVKENDDKDKDAIHWREKIWFSTREWDGEIVERRRNDRIAWKSVSGTQHSGVISFHKLDDKLTRVMVDIDFVPGGMIEKMASGMRFVKRAVQADLARFKAYVEFGEVEGLEYKSKPAEMEQHRDGDDDEEQKASDEAEDRSGNGSDRDRKNERQEREGRREERRKAMSGS
jgi:uncharacterized membrane protein